MLLISHLCMYILYIEHTDTELQVLQHMLTKQQQQQQQFCLLISWMSAATINVMLF